MKMGNSEAFVGFDVCKIPLSNVAQKIMSAMQSGDLVESENWRESEKTAEMMNKSSVKYSALLENGKNQSQEKKNLNSFTSQTSRTCGNLSPLSSSIRLTDQLSANPKQNMSLLAPSRCLIPQRNQEASVLQKMECKRKPFLKSDINNENKESMILKRKHVTCNNSIEKMSKHVVLEGEASLNPRNSRAFKNHFRDTRYLDDLEKSQLMETIQQAAALVVTLIYQDGSTQLRGDQARGSPVKGIMMLPLSPQEEGGGPLGAPAPGGVPEEGSTPCSRCVYIETEHSSTWGQEQEGHRQFARGFQWAGENKTEVTTETSTNTSPFCPEELLEWRFQPPRGNLHQDLKQLLNEKVECLGPTPWLDRLLQFLYDLHSSHKHQGIRRNQLVFRGPGGKVLFRTLKCRCPVICFNAKDFVRTVLQFLGDDGCWKHVADFVALDPRIAAWLIDPTDTAPSFEDLVTKYSENPVMVDVSTTYGNSSRHVVSRSECANLRMLYRLTMDLCSQLKVCGLWQLFCILELPLIPVLAAMESHKIRVNKEEMEGTSALLGARLKELEQEAHFAAGERFLITSSTQLREILFGKLKLHLPTLRATLPTVGPQRHLSTSEAVLNALKDLHPLPKIILEYRQVHKIKSTFVDGLLACMKKGCISSTWNQTGTVTGRLSAQHPNIQGISKHPIQMTKPQQFKGEEDKITISPRTMFVSPEGHTFLAADFSQIELRILAHLSGDPELLKLFQESERDDVFSTLTSQWKDVSPEHVTHTDREQTKRVVYAVVYGAGKERLAACLGVTVPEAARFLESFLQKYRKIKDFAQATIAQCHQTGYVASIMGRRRPLPRIRAQNPQLRAQAERQAVNFVVQGSAADLCKMAMVRIFAAVATSATLTARLVAQIHDELLFEVEDAQVPEFAALVRGAMESVQQCGRWTSSCRYP